MLLQFDPDVIGYELCLLFYKIEVDKSDISSDTKPIPLVDLMLQYKTRIAYPLHTGCYLNVFSKIHFMNEIGIEVSHNEARVSIQVRIEHTDNIAGTLLELYRNNIMPYMLGCVSLRYSWGNCFF